jgi:spore coat polysaccharide biosynthesis protein SpsF
MKTGLLITARLKSKRLKRKVLEPINSIPIISYLVERMKQQFSNDQIVIITSSSNQDKPLVEISKKLKIRSFKGDPVDVLKRMYDASKKFKFKNFISCTADNPFVDPIYAKKLLKQHIKQKNDLTIINGLPFGTFSYAINQKGLKKVIMTKASKNTEIWGPYFKECKKTKVGYYQIKNQHHINDKVRLTVDEKKDLDLIKKILSKSKSHQPSLTEILKILKKFPKLTKINSKVIQKPDPKAKFNYIK